jgi:hypothetical protein
MVITGKYSNECMLAVERRVTEMLLSDGGLMVGPQDVVELDPEVLQARAIFDAARSGLLGSVSGEPEMIDLAEAQRLLDALKTARTLAAEAEDRVLRQRFLLTSAQAKQRAAARRVADATSKPPEAPDVPENPGARVFRLRSVGPPRGAASVLVRAVLPAAAALAGAALARRLRRT